MPFAGLHSFRILDPDKFDDFRLVKDEFGDGVHVVYGLMGEGEDRTSEVQAIRFDVDEFSKSEAEDWLEENDFDAISYEAPAAEASKASRWGDMKAVVHNMRLLDAPRSAWAIIELEPRPDGKAPTQFRKELVREGDWSHPITRERLIIKKSDLAAWEKRFGEMTSAGMKVPILQDHMPMVDAGCGWVTGMELQRIESDGKKVWALFGILEFGDDWAAKILQGDVRDVSISIQDVRDSHEKMWKSVIDEVSVTLWPVIEGQTGFQKLGRAVGFSYKGPRRRSLLGRQGKEGDDRMALKRKRRREIPEVDLAKLEARMDSLEEENTKLKADLAARDTSLEESKTELKALHGAKVEAAKATVLSAIKTTIEDKKTLSPHAGEQLTAMVEEDFVEGVELAKAEARRDHYLGTLAAMTEKVIPDKRKVEGKVGEDGSVDGQDLSAFVSGILGPLAKK